MTEREKIIKIIADNGECFPDIKKCAECKYKNAEEDCRPFCTMYKTADALIAAGIGDVKETEHRAEVAEKALDKACADMGQLMDCCRWAANGGVITIEEYTPEKATPQAYIDRAEKELAEEKKDE